MRSVASAANETNSQSNIETAEQSRSRTMRVISPQLDSITVLCVCQWIISLFVCSFFLFFVWIKCATAVSTGDVIVHRQQTTSQQRFIRTWRTNIWKKFTRHAMMHHRVMFILILYGHPWEWYDNLRAKVLLVLSMLFYCVENQQSECVLEWRKCLLVWGSSIE